MASRFGLVAGTLTCLMLALPVAAGANTTVTLDARNPNFLDTHVALAAGETVSITASGNGTCQAGDHYYACPGGPDGSGILCANVGGGFGPGPAGANVPIGAVAAKVGSGTPFFVGHAGTATGPGELYVIYNDCIPPEGYEDNAGSFTVTIGTPLNPKNAVARIYEIDGAHAYVRHHGGRLMALQKHDVLYIGDEVVMDENSVGAIELLKGGRLGLKKGASLLIVSEGTVTNVDGTPVESHRSVIELFLAPEKPLTIQTRGGVMGIKG
jgi:hypothetical protein